jgi:protein TonB
MYNYEEPSMFSGKKGAILIVVLLLHVIVGYGFYSGLARRIAQTIIPPVEIAQIDKPKADDKPPPPPPKLEEIKPYVPPPEFVDIQAPQEANNNAITQTSQVSTPAPVAAPTVQHTFTPVKGDPNHPLHIGEDYYPDASKRAGEEGTCKVKITVGADGKINDASIETSSGFPRLDEACLKGVRGQRMKPALQDGKPIEYQGVLPITWKLKN